MRIVLLEPEIPQNSGNIGRTCACTGTELHLIKPLGFSLDEKHVRRAGLDYWKKLDLHLHESFEDFMSKYPDAKVYMASTKAPNNYTDVRYEEDAFIMFGKESSGIPEDILYGNKENCIRIPMGHDIRSLNIANSVAIILFEGLRQQGFTGLDTSGTLREYEW